MNATNKRGKFFNHKKSNRYYYVVELSIVSAVHEVVSIIGQTRRNLKSRLEEHSPEVKFSHKTDVTKHLLDN